MIPFYITAHFKNGEDRVYYLYYSDFRQEYQFKWAFTGEGYLDRPWYVQRFKWCTTIREALLNVSAAQGGDQMTIHRQDFTHFEVDGQRVYYLTFLNFY